MIVYGASSFKPRRKSKSKPTGVIAKKLDVRKLQKFSMTKSLTVSRPFIPRAGAELTMSIPSLQTTVCNTTKLSIMDATQLAKEAPEVREAIIQKSKRVAIPYSKGAYQYITEEADVKNIGRKNPVL